MIYYRTQLSILFYEEMPRGKTPDPIAEARITAVSDEKEKYNIENFGKAIFHMMMVLAPQTFWLERARRVTAVEIDEPIMEDELELSVPYSKRLNYAERYAVFFRSRRERSQFLRNTIDYWLIPRDELRKYLVPRSGDYEYDEGYIKKAEEEAIKKGRVKTRFDNELGRLVRVR